MPSSLSDGGVEPPPATLFGDNREWNRSSDGGEDYIVVDIEAGRGEEIVEFTAEDKTLRIYGILRHKYPKPIPICKEMLYFDMIYSKEEVNDTDIVLGIYFGDGDEGEMVTCYWMMNTHAYVDILKYNSARLGMDPIFESVTAEDLHFVCIQKAHVDKCVELFWDKFIEMSLPVHIPNLNGTTIHREDGFDNLAPPQIPYGARPSLSVYEDDEPAVDVTLTKKDE